MRILLFLLKLAVQTTAFLRLKVITIHFHKPIRRIGWSLRQIEIIISDVAPNP